MKCFYCPMIQDEMWNRIDNWIKYEGYVPSAEDIEDEIIAYCWCGKVGYKIWYTICYENTPYNRLTEEEWTEYCKKYDIPYVYPYENNDTKEKQEFLDCIPKVTKKQKKRLTDQKYKRKLRKLWKESTGWGSGAFPVDINGNYVRDDEEEFVRYKRQYNPRRAKYLRRIGNKKVRKGKDIPSRSGYRKVFDFCWELW